MPIARYKTRSFLENNVGNSIDVVVYGHNAQQVKDKVLRMAWPKHYHDRVLVRILSVEEVLESEDVNNVG